MTIAPESQDVEFDDLRGACEYLHCERCGRVDAIEPAELDEIRLAIRRRFSYEARFTHFPIVGLCAGCRATPAGP